MAARRPFWKWRCWKSIGFCLWPPSTCIWNLKLKFQSKLDLCSGNHVVYRQTDRRTDGRTRWIQYTSLGGGIKKYFRPPYFFQPDQSSGVGSSPAWPPGDDMSSPGGQAGLLPTSTPSTTELNSRIKALELATREPRPSTSASVSTMTLVDKPLATPRKRQRQQS